MFNKIRAIFSVIAMAIVGCGCASTGTTPAINDSLITADAALATTVALTAENTEYPGTEVAAAQATYEVGLAVNTAAKQGISLAAVQALAETYIAQANPQYGPLLGELVQMIVLNVEAMDPSAGSTTQPSTNPSTATAQELLEDLSAGVMQGAMAVPGVGTPTAAITYSERRPGTAIVVRHFVWSN